jgi:hypothetical protein
MKTQSKFAKRAILVLTGSLLLSVSALANSKSDALAAIYASAANVPTNIPGMHTYAEPPKGFDPVTATDEELATYGFPMRPDKQAKPDHYALWERAMRAARIRWNGQLKSLPGGGQGMRRPGRSPLTEVVHSNAGPAQVQTVNASGVMLFNKQTKWGKGSFNIVYTEMSVPVAELAFDYNGSGCSDVGFSQVNAAGIDVFGPSTDTNNAAYIPNLQGGVIEEVSCEGNASYYAFAAWQNPFTGIAFAVNPGDTFYTEITANGDSTDASVFIEDVTTFTYTSVPVSAPGIIGSSANWLVYRFCCDGPNPDGLFPLANVISTFFDYGAAEDGSGHIFYPGSQASSTQILTMMDDGGDQEIEIVNQGSSGYEGEHALYFQTVGCAYAGGCTP